MSKCTEYMELLSAYADGEVSETDKQRVEEHLETCENCSAVLGFFRETSVAAAESFAPVPEELLAGVMKEISEGAAGKADAEDVIKSAKKKKIPRVVLTRYVPIAACLALVLLTVPRFINLNRSDSKNMSGGITMSDMNSTQGTLEMGFSSGSADAPAPKPEAAAGGGHNSTADGSAPAASTAPAAPAPSMAPAMDIAIDPENDRGGDFAPEPGETGEEAYGDADDTAPGAEEALAFDDEASEAPLQEETPTEPSETDDTDVPEEVTEAVPAAPPTFTVPPISGGPGFPDGFPDGLPAGLPEEGFDLGGLLAEYEKGASILFTSSIYAIIEINGGLPAMLELYGLDPIEDREMYFELPREMAEMLIEFMRDLDGIKITIVDEEGEFAVLMYIP